MAADIRICTVYVTLKESVRNFTRVLSAWDSGSATVLAATNLLMLTLAGTQCPDLRGIITSLTVLISTDSEFFAPI